MKWDINKPNFRGFSNRILKKHPALHWESKEYLELKKDPELFELYQFISKINTISADVGYIQNGLVATFLPFVRKGMAEGIAWGMTGTNINSWLEKLSVRADDVGFGKINEISGELENGIPKYFTTDFSTVDKDGNRDYSDVSEDIFQNLIMYTSHMQKYKYLSEVEGQLKLIKTIETFKKSLRTSSMSKIVKKQGKPQELASNEKNTETYDVFLRALLYGQKYPLDDSDASLGTGRAIKAIGKAVNKLAGKEIYKESETPKVTSMVKTIDAANRAYSAKTLGFEMIPGAANYFGAHIQLSAQSGRYFKFREFVKTQYSLLANVFKTDEEKDLHLQLLKRFSPFKEDIFHEQRKEAGMTFLTRRSFMDDAFTFMRKPEIHVERSIFVTLTKNMMIENGKIVSIPLYVKNKYKNRYASGEVYSSTSKEVQQEIDELKKTRSIDVIKKLDKDGKLVIPGLDLNNQKRFTDLVLFRE